ncbi:MAG: hypothetical protein M3Y82_01610 [Verrucomicrobiota bacterium]|nr:hypothetical protein [Verrucomicrobiota bacterium]
MVIPEIEIEKKRGAWWAENYKSGMTIGETFQLIAQCAMLFPKTPEERQQKFESLKRMPEFVL